MMQNTISYVFMFPERQSLNQMCGLVDSEKIVTRVKCFDSKSIYIYVCILFKEITVATCIVTVINIKIRILLEVFNLIPNLKCPVGTDACF